MMRINHTNLQLIQKFVRESNLVQRSKHCILDNINVSKISGVRLYER